MNFFFVYDTAFCKSDEDDPKDAVVIFFPEQASEPQGHFLCSQLAGVAKFLKTTFSAPVVIGLDQGKLTFLWSGNYLLGLGANSDVHTGVLKDQLLFLCGIFCFYHGDMNTVLKECKHNRKDFLLKLELCWSRYVALSQCFGNVLQLSLKALPLKTGKKGSSIVANANRLLHLCQLSSFVTAGAVFYNSRVLATQFMPHVTNYLSLLSNSNASSPVSNARHTFKNLPPDVELKHIYLSPKCVSDIVKYNHTSCIGTRVRLKTCRRSRSKSFGSFNSADGSGSDGDVDSGNCSESVRSQKSEPRGGMKCCVLHSRLLEESLARSKNPRNQLLLLCNRETCNNLCRRKVTEDCGTSDSLLWHSKREYAYGAVSLLCHSHARLCSSSFLDETILQHSNLRSTADAEFRCPLCRNSTPINELSLKKCNSDFHLSKLATHDLKWASLRHRSSSDHSAGPRVANSARVQFLKCRSNSDSKFYKSKRIYSSRKHSGDPRGNGSPERLNREKCPNIEENDLQRHVLYVQRYGGSTLVLLLDKLCDEKVINYLWNCGFTVLRELECSTEKQVVEPSFINIEPSFYILLYNYVQRILKEYPSFPSLLLTEKHSKQTIQKIQEDFKTDSQLQTMCLLSSNYSIFASHRDQNFAFYLQPETNSRKLEPLLHLRGRAVRRLLKYFKVALEE